MNEHTRRLLIGVGCVLSTAFVIAAYNALSKYLQAEGVSVYQIIFFSFGISFLFSCFGKKLSFRVPYFSLYLYRTLAGVVAFYLLIISTKYLPLVDATLLFNTAPIFVPYLALFILGQRLNHKLWIPLVIGLIGITLVLRPGADVLNIAALIGVAAGVASAFVIVLAKKLSRVGEPPQILFYYFFLGTLLTGLPLLWTWTPISLTAALALVGIGLIAYLFVLTFTIGVIYIPATSASILLYAGIAFSALFDWWFWHHIPRFLTFIGILFIMASGTLSILLERKFEIKK